jgi:hypothetical protein
MKKVLTTTIIILLGIYAIGKNGFSNKNIHFAAGNIVDSNDYYIYHIDSINNTYIISAKSRGHQYKILTSKKNGVCDNKIKIGTTYHLNIEGVFHKFIPRDGVMPAAGLLVDSVTYLEFEDGFVKDFYTTKDLRGLCIITK